MFKKNHLFLILSTFSILTGHAQEEDVISVNADKIQQESDNNVEQVKVVTSEEIKDSGAKTVTDALRNLPGVTVNAVSPSNPTETITMQGLSGSYVKIMIDGVAVSGDIDGASPISQIPVENIDHIEVISGSSSVLYGSDAMGGAINIVTKKTQSEFDGVKINAGLTEEIGISPSTLNWRNYTAGNFSAAGENISGNITGSLDYTPGKEKYTNDALAGLIKYYESTQKRLSFLRGNADWSDDWGKIGAYGLYTDSFQICNFTKTGYDKGSTMEYDTSRLEGGITGEYIYDDNLKFTGFSAVKSYYLTTIYSVYAGAYSSENQSDTDFIEWESDLRGDWTFNSWNQIVFGLNGNYETIDSTSFSQRKKAADFSAFAQDTIKLFDERFTVIPGARLEFAPSIQGSDTIVQATPKISLRFDPFENTVVKLSYGMGYKNPSLKQKYWVFRHNYAPGAGNFILYGNTALKPEKSHGFNASLDQNVNNLFKIGISGYFNYIIDLIDSVVTDATSSPQIREYQNVDKAMTMGAEISLSSKIDRFEGSAGYAFTNAKAYNQDSDQWEDLGLRVKHRLTASASFLIPKIESKISINGEWNSRQLISTGGNTYTPDYLMVGARLSRKFLSDRLEVYLRGDNLLNNFNFYDGNNGSNQKDYYGLYDGRTFTIGARFNYKNK